MIGYNKLIFSLILSVVNHNVIRSYERHSGEDYCGNYLLNLKRFKISGFNFIKKNFKELFRAESITKFSLCIISLSLYIYLIIFLSLSYSLSINPSLPFSRSIVLSIFLSHSLCLQMKNLCLHNVSIHKNFIKIGL